MGLGGQRTCGVHGSSADIGVNAVLDGGAFCETKGRSYGCLDPKTEETGVGIRSVVVIAYACCKFRERSRTGEMMSLDRALPIRGSFGEDISMSIPSLWSICT